VCLCKKKRRRQVTTRPLPGLIRTHATVCATTYAARRGYSLYSGQVNAILPPLGTVPGAGVLTQTGFSGEILYSTNDSSLSIGDTISVNQTADYTFCFLAGTLIATPKGEVPVETLRRGDPIMTASGQVVSVKWVGYQKIHNSMFTSETRAPVCVSAGGVGGGLPHGDLFLTADHGLILAGVVINAGALVNGVTNR
ncbi:unnamed protein product, partial [Chrysoparadoxa australica]